MARKAVQPKPVPSKSAEDEAAKTVEQSNTKTGEATDQGGAAEATPAPVTGSAGQDTPRNTEGAGDARSDAAEAPSTPAAEQGHEAAGGELQLPAGEIAMIVVTGPARGRRRIGRKFDRTPVLIPVDELSQGEITELTQDPMLHVVLPPAPDV